MSGRDGRPTLRDLDEIIWRHRFITDAWGWELPAGWTDGDESRVDAAAREVEEETPF